MKKLLIITLLVHFSISAQTTQFTYSWDINQGSLIINFKNDRSTDFGSSRAGKGKIEIKCRQTFLDFIDVLQSDEIASYHFEGLEIYSGVLEGYILLISDGKVWKLSKPEAVVLANQLLSVPSIISNQIVNCVERECVCE